MIQEFFNENQYDDIKFDQSGQIKLENAIPYKAIKKDILTYAVPYVIKSYFTEYCMKEQHCNFTYSSTDVSKIIAKCHIALSHEDNKNSLKEIKPHNKITYIHDNILGGDLIYVFNFNGTKLMKEYIGLYFKCKRMWLELQNSLSGYDIGKRLSIKNDLDDSERRLCIPYYNKDNFIDHKKGFLTIISRKLANGMYGVLEI